MVTTKAPIFNSFNALKPIPPRSGVVAVLDAAEEISRRCTDADRMAHDNKLLRAQADGLAVSYERLVEENAELRCRIQELEAEDDDKARMIGTLQAEIEQLEGRLICAGHDRQDLRIRLEHARAKGRMS